MSFVNTALLGFVVHYSGGIISPFIFAFFSIIISEASYGIEYPTAPIAALLVYLAVVGGEYWGFFKPISISAQRIYETTIPTLAIAVVTGAFIFMTGHVHKFILKTLRARLEKENQEKQSIMREISRLEAPSQVGLLVNRVVHDVNGPLGAIEGFIRMFEKKENLSTRAKGDCELMLKELQRVSHLVKRLTQYTKKTTSERQPISVVEILETVLAVISFFPGAHQVDIVSAFKDYEDILVVGDREQLQQVYFNLLKNALEVLKTKEWPRRIECRVAQEGSELIVKIQDNGPGISKEISEKLGQEMISTKKEGTGVGLMIVKDILRSHGGDMSIQSEEGKGTCVITRLPIYVSQDSPTPMAKFPMKAVLPVFAMFCCSLSFGAGYEFEGVGARQVSRGGAAIADSDDWTATYWNPANIVLASRQGREVGLEIFGGFAYGKDSNSLSNLVGPIFQKQELDSPFVLGAMGVVLPVGERLGLGFGFYTPLLQGFDFQDTSNLTGTSLNEKAYAAILAWNASASYRLTQTFSVGVGVNLLYGRLSNDTTLVNPPFPPPLATDTQVGHASASGFGPEGVVGLRYDPDPKFSLGAVYRTGANVRLRGNATASSQVLPSESSDFTFVLKQPATTGFGVAYKPSPNWVLTTDLNWTFWSSFSNATTYDNQGTLLQNQQDTFHWRNTYKIRFGAVYRLTEKTDLLGGYSFGNPAVDAGSIDLSTTIDVPMHRFSGGVTHRWRDWIETSLGALGGYGTRTEGSVHYRLSGWQLMLESRFHF